MSDDDWETDPDFENTLTDAERRRVGCAIAAEGLRRDKETGGAAQRSKAFSLGILNGSQLNSPDRLASAMMGIDKMSIDCDDDHLLRLSASRAAAEKRSAELAASRRAQTSAVPSPGLSTNSAIPSHSRAETLEEEEGDLRRGLIGKRTAIVQSISAGASPSPAEKSEAEQRAAERASRAQWIMAQRVAAAAGRDEALKKAAAYKAAVQKGSSGRLTGQRMGAADGSTPKKSVTNDSVFKANTPNVSLQQCRYVLCKDAVVSETAVADQVTERIDEALDGHSSSASAGVSAMDSLVVTRSSRQNPAEPMFSQQAHSDPEIEPPRHLVHSNHSPTQVCTKMNDVALDGEDEVAKMAAQAVQSASIPSIMTYTTQHAHLSKTMQLKVGSRVLAISPDSDFEESAASQWISARVIAERTVNGSTQYKMSFDGYESEDDKWIEPDSSRVRPHNAILDTKEAAAHEKRNAEVARLRNEKRRAQEHKLHDVAMKSGELMD
eukprot:scaffold303802_cov28-Tisochrysis_lutea.AAC.1